MAELGKQSEKHVKQAQFEKKASIQVEMHWLVSCDIQEVLKIERSSFEFPWEEHDFLVCQHQRNCTAMTARHNNHVIGFMVYELHASKIHVLNFAVAPDFRRLKVGTQMAEQLFRKLSQQRRQQIVLQVRETNVVGQLFFRSQGFRAVTILRNYYPDCHEDGYIMSYRREGDQPTKFFNGANRITSYL